MKRLFERLLAAARLRPSARETAGDLEPENENVRGRTLPVSSWAQTFQATVPTRATAEELADALALRGHVLVGIREVDHFLKDPSSFWYGKPSLRTEEQGHWDVCSVATGPMPDEDVEWWQAQEEQAVRRLATRFGGNTGSSGGGGTELLIRTFAREGLAHELDETTVAVRRLAALAESPARSGEPETRSINEDLPDQPGEALAISGIEDIGWASLSHAYGPATDVPDLLRGLAANDDQWDDLHSEFVGSVLHQGSNYSSSAPALRILGDLAAAPRLAPKRRLDLLYTLFLAGTSQAQAEAHGYRPDKYAAEVQATVIRALDPLLPLWSSLSRAEQRLLILLAALADQSIPQTDLNDPASRLALAMIHDQDAEATLRDLATRHEDLIELVENEAPLRSRLIAALERLLWEP